MKLAEALLLRSDMQKNLLALQQRIQQNVLIQEGDEPSENATALIQQSIQLNQELYHLIGQIHLTNAQAVTEKEIPLITLLNQRDCYSAEHKILQQALNHAQRDSERYSVREIRWLKTISVQEIQKQLDGISTKLRQLNLEIQASNWHIDLV